MAAVDPGGRGGPKLEVTVARPHGPAQRIRLRHSPATVGRGSDVDIQLESPHISRVHGRVFFDAEGIRVVDAGSANGFTVRGRRLTEARIEEEEPVEVCGFELRFRWLEGARPSAPAVEAEAARGGQDGWEDEKAEDLDAATMVKAVPRAQEQSRGPLPFRLDPTISAESVLNRLAYRQETDGGAAEEKEEDLDAGDLEELRAPDLPPLLVTMHEEANALLYNDPFAEVAVEVIQVVGDTIYDVDLLYAGESCWWGGKPRGLARLWTVPTAARFPLATHVDKGVFQVQIPQDPRWKMFHRSRTGVEPHRSGQLAGCRAEAGDQIEVSFGPFTSYVRCVRAPPRLAWHIPWRALVPSRLAAAALLLSAAAHAAIVGVPMQSPPRVDRRVTQADRFVDVERTAAQVEPAPQAEQEPQVAETAVERPAAPPKPARPATRPSRRPPRRAPAPKPAAAPAEPRQQEPPAAPALATVSVSDFQVSGLIDHLPTARIDGRGPSVRAGPSILRGDSAPAHAVVSKSGNGMRLDTQGELSEGQVRRVINTHARDVDGCLRAALAYRPSLHGRMEVTWVVDRVGVVSNVRVAYDEVGSASLSSCVRSAIKRWVFPPPKGGAASVRFPFIFSNLRR